MLIMHAVNNVFNSSGYLLLCMHCNANTLIMYFKCRLHENINPEEVILYKGNFITHGSIIHIQVISSYTFK